MKTIVIGITLLAAALPLSATGQVGPVPAATPLPVDPADLPLQVEIYEPFFRQSLVGGITVVYREKLDRETDIEKEFPGIHAAMIEAALAQSVPTYDADLAVAKIDARAAIHRVATPAQLSRLAFLFGPWIAANRGRPAVFQPGDTTRLAGDRWLAELVEDRGYQARLRVVSAEPSMRRLLIDIAPIMTAYQKKVGDLLGVAVQGGLQAAHVKANAIAVAKGFGPLYDDAK